MSPFSAPFFSGAHKSEGFCFQSERLLYGKERDGVRQAAALLIKNPKPSDEDINAAMVGNICRCGTYQRIRRAIHRAAQGGQ
jgi:[2Fe-2S] binding domain